MGLAVAKKKFERKSESFRKEALIQATLSLIAREGIDAATVRAIAYHADVTPGLIRHYFSTKEDLVSAAYEHHMNKLTQATGASQEQMKGTTPIARLVEFVRAGLSAPVVDPESVALWAGFMNRVRQDHQMRMIHRKTYYEFRDRLEALIKDVLTDQRRSAEPAITRRLAIACNAVIDGLWLEGGALPEAFNAGEIADIGLQSVDAIVGLDLSKGY